MTNPSPSASDPSARLAAAVVGHLLEAGLIDAEDEAAVAGALATGQAAPDDWVRWVQNGCSKKGKPLA